MTDPLAGVPAAWSTRTIHAAGSGLQLAWRGDEEPVVTHWGPDLGDADLAGTVQPAVLHSSFDAPRTLPLLPTQADGWSGTPAIELLRGGVAVPLRLRTVRVDGEDAALRVALVDEVAEVALELRYAFDRHGVLACTATVTNRGGGELTVLAIRIGLPLPVAAQERLDTTGRWSGERRPQRAPIVDGVQRRATRRGRTGHDGPMLQVAGTPGFGFRHGEVRAVHVAWSGDAEYTIERLPEGAGALDGLLSGAETLAPGELRLAPGAAFTTPEVLFVWSDAGLDGLSARLHAHVRDLAAHPSSPRPLVLNTWEAVYMQHDLGALTELAQVAARIGVERFVLDDGWMQDRRTDHDGLGEWLVDPAVWPDGLSPLADAVRGLGMGFGLWFEPEMVNPSSRVAVEHPEWLLAPPAATGPAWRFQHVLNLAHPDAFAFLLERIDRVVREVGVEFIKWDHNRDLHEPVDRVGGSTGVHAQTLAAYALMDELRRRNPGLEIESCASGGARVDLGVLAHAQRVWASDTNDAIERQGIQRWTGLLVPPELVGSHVGPERAHTTGRRLDLSFRLVTALFGHAGLEWDVRTCSEDDLRVLARWAEYYKAQRGLLHAGTTVRTDHLRDGSMLHGVVAPDRARGLFAWVQLETSAAASSARTPIPGLDPARRYRVRLREDLGPVLRRSIADPPWVDRADGVVLSGAALAGAGVPLPVLQPGQALLIEVDAV